MIQTPVQTVAPRPQLQEKKQILPKVSMDKLNISIDYHKNIKGNLQQTVQSGAGQKRQNIFTAEALESAWFEYIKQLEQEHVRQMMNDAELQCTEHEPLFDVFVTSALQKEILAEEHSRVVEFLRNALSNDNIDFNVVIKAKDQSVKKVVTNADHFKEMLEQNENFRFLAQELGMELS